MDVVHAIASPNRLAAGNSTTDVCLFLLLADGPLGMGLGAKKNKVFVKSVASGGQAEKQGVQVGDVIALVEGELASEFTPKQILVCLKKAERPLEIGFRRKNPEFAAANAAAAQEAADAAEAAKAFAEARRKRKNKKKGKHEQDSRDKNNTDDNDKQTGSEATLNGNDDAPEVLQVAAPSSAEAAVLRQQKVCTCVLC